MDSLSAPAASAIDYVRARLAEQGAPPARQPGDDHIVSAHETEVAAALAEARPAAVLIGLIDRPEGATVLLTERATYLRSHSGQVAFPGGKIDDGEDAVAAALREAEEEIGLARRHVEPFALLDPYLSGSGYRITPVVAQIHPPFDLTINAHEVSETFETPFAFVMNPENHQRQSREWKGATRHFYAMPWESHYIWGVTAGILRNLYERLYR
ncbi:MAG: CoA pyrophosphatase [Hyphomicrobiales bacterium]|nr:CoA pyrophosphatase [Hyphomicrobiales bacterium]